MGSLPPELQHFLTRVSVLMAVDVESAMLVDDRPAEAVAASIRESERLGLLTRPDSDSPHRFHHLVREFLMARLAGRDRRAGGSSAAPVHRRPCPRHRLVRGRLALPDGRRPRRMLIGGGRCARRDHRVRACSTRCGHSSSQRPATPRAPAALILRARVCAWRAAMSTRRPTVGSTRAVEQAGDGPLPRDCPPNRRSPPSGSVGMDEETVELASAALDAALTRNPAKHRPGQSR